MQQAKYYPIFFAPDEDPSWGVNPGVLTSVSNVVPTRRGTLKNYSCNTALITGTYSVTAYGSPLIGTVLKKIDGTGRMFVATNKRLLEVTNMTTVVDQSKGGADYTSATDFRYNLDWDYTTFGNDVIFVNKKNPPQVSSSSVFADVSGGPPKAACCTTNKNFVLLGNCNDGTNDYGDQVWWSALGNDASWTAAAATQAGNYRLRDTPGNVTALVNMRDTVVAYKEDSIYIGDYQGSPLLWTWRLVTDKAGCAAAHGVVVVDGIHYFIHRTGVYRFDGASVQPIGRGVVNKFIGARLALQSGYNSIVGAYDETEGVILWYFSSNFDVPFDSILTRSHAIAYHPASDRFGYIQNTRDAGTCFTVMRATLSDLVAWNSGMDAINYNVLTVGTQAINTDTADLLGVRFGATTSATVSVTLGDIGNDLGDSKITRIQTRALSYSGSMSNATVYGRRYESQANDSGTTFTADATNQRWDGLKSSRWFNATLPITNYGEIAGVYLTSVPSGAE